MNYDQVEIITVNYNTVDLTTRLYKSIRDYIGDKIKMRVIDGSDRETPRKLLNFEKEDKNLTVKRFGYNIHHGRGMDYGLTTTDKKYVLILDSDSYIKKSGIVEEMMGLMEDETYCVGEVLPVSTLGVLTTIKNMSSIFYIHPRCMLVNVEEYKKFHPFKNHGAPCIFAMRQINAEGKITKLVDFNRIHDYFYEDRGGTVNKFGYNLGHGKKKVKRIVRNSTPSPTIRKKKKARKKRKSVYPNIVKSEARFSIIVRTSRRPNYFRDCYESIKNQNYSNYKIIASYDDFETFEYLSKYPDVVKVGVKRQSPGSFGSVKCRYTGRTRKPAPYNLYLNSLISKVRDGYVIILDDDDCFNTNSALETINNNINGQDCMLMWRVLFPDEQLVPNNRNWGEMPVCCNFSMIGFSFNIKYRNFAKFDQYRFADFTVGMSLWSNIPEKVFINEQLTKIQRKVANGLGRRDDK